MTKQQRKHLINSLRNGIEVYASDRGIFWTTNSGKPQQLTKYTSSDEFRMGLADLTFIGLRAERT